MYKLFKVIDETDQNPIPPLDGQFWVAGANFVWADVAPLNHGPDEDLAPAGDLAPDQVSIS